MKNKLSCNVIINSNTEKLTINENINNTNAITRTLLSSHFLDIYPVLQGDYEWCAAAATAAVTNYLTGASHTAESVTVYELGSALDVGLTNSQINDFLADHDVYYIYSNSYRSFSQVTTNINNGQPNMMKFECTPDGWTGDTEYHLMTIRGYWDNDTTDYYSVLNPWYNYSELITATSTGANVTYNGGGWNMIWIQTWHSMTYNPW